MDFVDSTFSQVVEPLRGNNHDRMDQTRGIPTLGQLREHDAGETLEFICQASVCRHSAMLRGDLFERGETMLSLSAKARCSRCGGRQVLVQPIWTHTKDYGL